MKAAALITYYFTRNSSNTLVYTIVISVVASCIAGAPVESIISATASAPHPVWAGVIMMLVIGLILVFGLLPRISKYVPASSIAGFLFVLGIFKTVALDAPAALAANPAVGGTAMVVTAITNPFLGMVAGVVARFLGL